jgi:hypothetical protein
MEEAFKKAGLVTEQEIEQREATRKKEEAKVKEQEAKRERHRKDKDRVYKEEILKKYKPFDERWQDPAKQKFIAHLIFSYVPADVPYHPWGDDELKEKKCCICGHALISKQFIMQNLDKVVTTGMDQIKRSVDGETINVREEFVKDFGDVVMAVVSPKSSAAFCTPCFRDFYAWIEYMLFRGNQQIYRIIRKRRIESSLSEEQLKEYEAIDKEKDIETRKKKLQEFFERVDK